MSIIKNGEYIYFIKLIAGMRTFILLFFITSACFLNAQETKIDSLLIIINSSKQDTSKVILMLELAKNYTSINKSVDALNYLNQAKSLAEKLNYKSGLVKVYREIGQFYRDTDHNLKALVNLLKSIKIAEEIEDKKAIIETRVRLLPVYLYQRNYDEALKNEFQSLKMAKDINDNRLIATAYMNIGVIYSTIKNYKIAMDYLFKAVEAEKGVLKKRVTPTAYGNLANIYYYFFNDYNKAINYYEKLLNFGIENGVTVFEAQCYMQIGICYVRLNNYNKALTYLNIAKSLSIERNDKTTLKDTYYYMAELYRLKDDFKPAYNYLNLYSELQDSIFTKETARQIADMNTKYQTEKKDDEIKFLNREKELQKAELNQKNINQRNLIIGATSIILLLSSIGLLFFKNYKQKQQSVVYKLENEKIISDLSFLKAQVNPHMIFNTINTIYIQLDEDLEEGRENLVKFADVMRYQLYDCNEAFVDVSREIIHIYNYIELQKLRKSADIKISLDISNQIEGLLIAPLLFIPLVENAFKYLSNFKDRDNIILISLFIENNKLIFNCENSCLKKLASQQSEFKYGGIGLVNLKRRLELIYPNKHSFIITQDNEIFKTKLIIDAN